MTAHSNGLDEFGRKHTPNKLNCTHCGLFFMPVILFLCFQEDVCIRLCIYTKTKPQQNSGNKWNKCHFCCRLISINPQGCSKP